MISPFLLSLKRAKKSRSNKLLTTCRFSNYHTHQVHHCQHSTTCRFSNLHILQCIIAIINVREMPSHAWPLCSYLSVHFYTTNNFFHNQEAETNEAFRHCLPETDKSGEYRLSISENCLTVIHRYLNIQES